MKLVVLGIILSAFGNDLLALKKKRKNNRIEQRRGSKSQEKKFVDPAIFAKFKQEMQNGAFKGLIRAPAAEGNGPMPPKVQKARPFYNTNREAESKSMQFGDWTQRFSGARPTGNMVKPTSRPLMNRYGPRPFLKDTKSFGRQSGVNVQQKAAPKYRPSTAKPSPFGNQPSWASKAPTWVSKPTSNMGQFRRPGPSGPQFPNRPTPTNSPNTITRRRFPMSSVPQFTMKVAKPQWSQAVTLKSATRSTTRPTTLFNMCLNGGIYQLGVGCLCVGNFAGDFCDECIPGWNGQKCDNPANLCTINAATVDCSSRWLFNLTLLQMPTSTKTINMEFNGLIKSGAFRKKIARLNAVEQINLKGNYFARFPLRMFANQPELAVLNVASNFLFALPADIFTDLPVIKIIDFKNNNIKALDPNIFEKNFEMEVIDFSNNNLAEICRGIFAYQTKLTFVAFNRNDDLPLPLNKWFGSCPYEDRECEKSFPQSQYGGPVINLRRRIGAFGESC